MRRRAVTPGNSRFLAEAMPAMEYKLECQRKPWNIFVYMRPREINSMTMEISWINFFATEDWDRVNFAQKSLRKS